MSSKKSTMKSKVLKGARIYRSSIDDLYYIAGAGLCATEFKKTTSFRLKPGKAAVADIRLVITNVRPTGD
ncbi:hypothetical protein [uncultured Mediterranean phage]|nr:hypothetical protein [uncultured Mediterranean phage]